MKSLTRQQLYDSVWSKPTMRLAKELGVSDVAVAKACKRHGIPKPSLGYWTKVAHGRRVNQPPLPKLDDEGLQTIRFEPVPAQSRAPEYSKETTTRVKAERADANRIVVPDQLDSAHPLVSRTEKSLRSATTTEEGLVRPKAKGCLDLIIGPAGIDRAVRIMDAFLKALEGRGMKISTHDEEMTEQQLKWLRPYESSRKTLVKVDGETFSIRMTESIGEREVSLTPAQKKENGRTPYFPKYKTHEKYPRGMLTITVRCDEDTYINKRWSELDGKKLNDRLNSVVAWMYKAAEERKNRERRRQQWQRQSEIDERLRAEAAERRRKEEAQIAALEAEVTAWHQAERIRRYVDAAERAAIDKHGAVPPESEIGQRFEWARRYADSVDPLRRNRTV